MKNQLNGLFERKKREILSVYFTAGYPSLNDTAEIIRSLESNGVDLIEVGMPFSDPLADGPVIQQSSGIALKNGMSIKVLFEQLEKAKAGIPLILMGYLNPILQYGIERFCKEASGLGIAGCIIPDLPLQEYLEKYKIIFEVNGLKNIFLITPQTSEERIRLIDLNSDAFIYMVASSSTTGAKNNISIEQESYFKRIREMKLRNPVLIGFGISDRGGFKKVCEYASGAIIGSAFIKAISKSDDIEETIEVFIGNILHNETIRS